MILNLEAKADAEDEGGDRWDEAREEGIEGKGANLIQFNLSGFLFEGKHLRF